jgi:hypothetical protein
MQSIKILKTSRPVGLLNEATRYMQLRMDDQHGIFSSRALQPAARFRPDELDRLIDKCPCRFDPPSNLCRHICGMDCELTVFLLHIYVPLGAMRVYVMLLMQHNVLCSDACALTSATLSALLILIYYIHRT